MKTLLILRHAKSSWKEAGLSDHDRPLNDRGKRDAPRMGKLLADHHLHPDLILSSTAKRARSTAKRAIKGGDLTCPLELVDDFYLAPPETYVSELRQQPDSHNRILVIGHNPGLEELVELLTGDGGPLPTAALVQVEFDVDSWSQLAEHPQGHLRGKWLPRELE